MYAGQYGFWKVAGLVRNCADMARLAGAMCPDSGAWGIEDGEMIIYNARTDAVIACLKLED